MFVLIMFLRITYAIYYHLIEKSQKLLFLKAPLEMGRKPRTKRFFVCFYVVALSNFLYFYVYLAVSESLNIHLINAKKQ